MFTMCKQNTVSFMEICFVFLDFVKYTYLYFVHKLTVIYAF